MLLVYLPSGFWFLLWFLAALRYGTIIVRANTAPRYGMGNAYAKLTLATIAAPKKDMHR